jgi:hypothetical protein
MTEPRQPTSFHTRAMPEIRNPVYAYDMTADFKRTPTPRHVLEQPPQTPPGVDPRLTAAGSTPPVSGLPPYVPYAGQTPYNVWALYPA